MYPTACALAGPPGFTLVVGVGGPLGPAIREPPHTRELSILLTPGQTPAAPHANVPTGEAAIWLAWTSGSPTGAEGAAANPPPPCAG